MWSRAPLQLALESHPPLGSGLFWLVWPPSHQVSAGLLEAWPCSGCGLGVLPAIAQTQLSPRRLCPPGGPPSSEPLGRRSLRAISTTASTGHPAQAQPPHARSA